MLGSTYKDETLSSCEWYGRQVECELCQRVRRCTERFEMVTCQDCQAEFLPTPAAW